MNPSFCTLFLLFLLAASRGSAQTGGRISSVVLDEKSAAAPDALITLYRPQDSSVLQTTFTDLQGAFSFSGLASGNYGFSVEKEGYDAYHSAPLVLSDAAPRLQVDPVRLQLRPAQSIAGVTVKAATPFVQKKIDRTIVNPDALISNAGLTALDVLAKSPGVRVDAEGLISLLGRPGVVVFIDDRPSNLSDADLASYLRSLPASTIQSFEIMTNPPAKYDAAGNSGIINIRMKKMSRKGFNGSANINYGQGIYPRFNSGVVLNYRVNKLNVFSSLSYNRNNVFQDLTVNRRYFTPSGGLSSIFNQHTLIRRELTGLNFRAGVDYYINATSTLGIVANGFRNSDARSSDNVARLYAAEDVLQHTVVTGNPTQRRFRNVSVNANYTYKPGEKRGELSINADVLRYNSGVDQSLQSTTYRPDGAFDGSSLLVSSLPAEIAINTLKIDYSKPVSRGRIEAGGKASYINTDNVAGFFDERNGLRTINDEFTNSFAYREDIEAAYVNCTQDWKKFSAQLGLRFERTGISGRQYGSRTVRDSTFVREFNNLFPTFYLQYKPDSAGNHQISVSYGRRIDRPDYQSMNPFTYPLDRFTLYSGNPFLQPTFANNLELAYSYKDILNVALIGGYVRDMINETISQGTNTFLSKPGNIGRQFSYGLAADFGKPLTAWWTLQLHAEVMYNISQAQINGRELDNRGAYWYAGPVNQFVFPKGWSAELSGSYLSSVRTAQFIMIPLGSASAAVSKKLLEERLTLKLAVNDLFYTDRPGGEIIALGNSAASWRSRMDSRVATLALTYRLGTGKAASPRRSDAAESERSRVR